MAMRPRGLRIDTRAGSGHTVDSWASTLVVWGPGCRNRTVARRTGGTASRRVTGNANKEEPRGRSRPRGSVCRPPAGCQPRRSRAEIGLSCAVPSRAWQGRWAAP